MIIRSGICLKKPESLQNISTISLIVFVLSILIFPNSSITINGLQSLLTTQIFHIPAVIFTFGLLFFNRGKIILDIPSIIALITIVYIIVSQLFIGGATFDILAAARGFSYYILAYIFLQHLSKKHFFVICDWILWYCLFVLLIDTIYRFSIFGLTLRLSMADLFYWKKTSLFFYDTNTSGVLTVILVFFAYYLYTITKNKKYSFLTIIFLILTVLTVSRAAMIGAIVTFGYLIIKNIIQKFYSEKNLFFIFPKIKLILLIYVLFAIVFSIFGFYIGLEIVKYLLQDGSFITKIDLFSDTILFIKKAHFEQLLFGIGFENAELYTGRYAHAYIPTYIIETGLIGYTLVTSLLISIFLCAKKTILILIPFFVVGISFIAHFGLGLLYTVLAFICYYENHYKNGGLKNENPLC